VPLVPDIHVQFGVADGLCASVLTMQ
jgi:hypothetical protein